MLTLLFSNCRTFTEEKKKRLAWLNVCFTHSKEQFLTWEIGLSSDKAYTQSFCGEIWNLSQIERGGVIPFSLLARQAQVPCELCRGGGPESARCLWLCLVQRCRGCVACETCIHCSVAEQGWIELEKLSRHKRVTDKKEWERLKGRKARLSTDEGI